MTSNTTLKLNLPPEVAKIMPWIVLAKASGNPVAVAWAKREYQIAAERAQERERREREREEQRLQIQREYEARKLERQRWFQEEVERERKYLEAWCKLREIWQCHGIHFALEDGWEEMQPTQSSTKGDVRFISEFLKTLPKQYIDDWGYGTGTRHKNSWRNHGRKPRTFRDFR